MKCFRKKYKFLISDGLMIDTLLDKKRFLLFFYFGARILSSLCTLMLHWMLVWEDQISLLLS